MRLRNPATFISSTGLGADPAAGRLRATARRGPRAARYPPLLADVPSSYPVSELRLAAQLRRATCRAAGCPHREALVERSRRGAVDRWISRSSASLEPTPTTCRDATLRLPRCPTDWRGPRAARRTRFDGGRRLITGSFAAVRGGSGRRAGLAAVYCDDPAALARERGLLPADEGANVVLLTPITRWSGSEHQDGRPALRLAHHRWRSIC